jgi:hypothetical protein
MSKSPFEKSDVETPLERAERAVLRFVQSLDEGKTALNLEFGSAVAAREQDRPHEEQVAHVSERSATSTGKLKARSAPSKRAPAPRRKSQMSWF